ncbi:hypothetical protein JZ751_029257, partial [Albula glossodonta]
RQSFGEESHRSSNSALSSSLGLGLSSQSQTPLPSQPSTPCPALGSHHAKQSRESPAPPAADRLEALAQALLLALEQHQGRQQEIQTCIKALSRCNINDDGQVEQRGMTTQHQVALEDLQKLTPPTANQPNQDK